MDNLRPVLKTRVIAIVILAMVFVFPACSPREVSFVVVREENFRIGPVPLPLDEQGKRQVKMFLEKGGDNSKRDQVDFNVEKRYDPLFKLLADPSFLYAEKFRKEDEIGKISLPLEEWFEKKILYSIIDATQKKPLAIPPLSVKDKNGKYWWVFYFPQDGKGGGNLKISKLLITVATTKDIRHYEKE
ncbi:MAG: hypothetical protein GY940_25325 [bacterium]|nr:hypothetical protein [bacterium]